MNPSQNRRNPQEYVEQKIDIATEVGHVPDTLEPPVPQAKCRLPEITPSQKNQREILALKRSPRARYP